MRSQIGTARAEPAAKIDVETNMVVHIREFIPVLHANYSYFFLTAHLARFEISMLLLP